MGTNRQPCSLWGDHTKGKIKSEWIFARERETGKPWLEHVAKRQPHCRHLVSVIRFGALFFNAGQELKRYFSVFPRYSLVDAFILPFKADAFQVDRRQVAKSRIALRDRCLGISSCVVRLKAFGQVDLRYSEHFGLETNPLIRPPA